MWRSEEHSLTLSQPCWPPLRDTQASRETTAPSQPNILLRVTSTASTASHAEGTGSLLSNVVEIQCWIGTVSTPTWVLLVAVHCVSVLASLPPVCLCETDQRLLWVSQEAGCGKLFAGHTEPQVTATWPKNSFFFLVEKSIGEGQENCVVSAIAFCLTILNHCPSLLRLTSQVFSGVGLPRVLLLATAFLENHFKRKNRVVLIWSRFSADVHKQEPIVRSPVIIAHSFTGCLMLPSRGRKRKECCRKVAEVQVSET